jgi:hypothetical protein
MTINYKGLFVISLFVAKDGSKVFVQDEAIKYHDYKHTLIPRSDGPLPDSYSQILFGKYLPFLFSYINSNHGESQHFAT